MTKTALIDVEGRELRVTESGDVYVDGRQRTVYVGKVGYPAISIWNKELQRGKPYYVHRLLAQAFLPNPDGLNEVNHLDGNKTNNSLDNLEWCTHKRNMSHAANELGKNRRKPVVGRKGGVTLVLEHQHQAGQFGLHQPLISKCLAGDRKTHGGFTWEEYDASTYRW